MCMQFTQVRMWSCCTNKTKKIKEAFEPFTYKICTDSVIISADVAYKKEKLLFERVRKKNNKDYSYVFP